MIVLFNREMFILFIDAGGHGQWSINKSWCYSHFIFIEVKSVPTSSPLSIVTTEPVVVSIQKKINKS